MSTRFEKAVTITLEHEGGYVHHKYDPGGETNFGITKRRYPELDIKNLTRTEAKKIYFRDYWRSYMDKMNCEGAALKLFDLSVNMGHRQATKLIQRALKSLGIEVDDDGLFGPVTMSATNRAHCMSLCAALRSEAAGFYRVLAEKDIKNRTFLKGWLKRAYS